VDNVTMIAFATLLLETAKELISRGSTIEEVVRFTDKAVEIFDKATAPVARYSVRLQSFGNKKIDCIRIVREFTGMGLKEAKELVESEPCEVLKTSDEEEARRMLGKFWDLNMSNDCDCSTSVKAHIIYV
jgi:large subunit ribosomal protein L7/L12